MERHNPSLNNFINLMKQLTSMSAVFFSLFFSSLTVVFKIFAGGSTFSVFSFSPEKLMMFKKYIPNES